jgi:NAD(P)-dependent dehydrogenase (short-subunit alcohol dehydrogenase family)
MDFEDKEVLIKGAGTGIGQPTALLFATSRMDIDTVKPDQGMVSCESLSATNRSRRPYYTSAS